MLSLYLDCSLGDSLGDTIVASYLNCPSILDVVGLKVKWASLRVGVTLPESYLNTVVSSFLVGVIRPES